MNSAVLEWLERGQQALDRHQPHDAATAFREAVQGAPHELGIRLALANAWRLAGDTLAARKTLIDAQRHAPWTDVGLLHELGSALLESGAPKEAAACFLRVSRSRPTDPAPLGALAGAKRMAGEPAAAWAFIERALLLAPEHPTLLLTAAQIRHDLADLDGARDFLDRADAVRPHHHATQLQRAYTSLLRGPSAEGWQHFESRPLPVPQTSARPWHGESLVGASIAVTAEQGVGDQFQFVRFVSALSARGAREIVVECHADAVTLFRESGWHAVPRGTAPQTDWHVPMMSLPHRLQCDRDVAGDRVPYLLSSQGPVSATSEPRATATRRLGLVWAGNPAFSGRITRDLDPALLPSIAAIRGIEWLSLQHGDAASEAPASITRSASPADWLATARILRSLDGLVTTDTGIAHLAGAMGIRTWVLLQYVPDWRWGLSGAHSAWYPTLTLLRQPAPGEWRDVITQLERALTQG